MLNATHGSLRRIAGLGVAAAVALGGVTLAAPASADEQTTVVEKRVVIGDGHIKSATWNDGQEMKVDCPGQLTVIEAGTVKEKDKQQKAKMVFCSKSGDKAETVAGLEKALARVEKDSDMDSALRAELASKLKVKIAELRGQ